MQEGKKRTGLALPLDCCALGPYNQTLLLQPWRLTWRLHPLKKRGGRKEKKKRTALLWVAVSAASENFQTMAVA